MAASVTLVQAEQQRLSAKLIRLHVVANSDSAHDQAVKLEVRDAVSAAAKALLDGAEDPRAALAGRLDAVADAAAARLRELGEDLPVTVRLGKERFPTREYDTFSLPAGVYESLRVTIGAGKGHNWWCVVFPSLCLTSSMDELELADGWVFHRGDPPHHRRGGLPAQIPRARAAAAAQVRHSRRVNAV